jgi:hypothetical protein
MKIKYKKLLQIILYLIGTLLAENKFKIVDNVSTILEASASTTPANPSPAGNEATLNHYGAQAPQPLSSL